MPGPPCHCPRLPGSRKQTCLQAGAGPGFPGRTTGASLWVVPTSPSRAMGCRPRKPPHPCRLLSTQHAGSVGPRVFLGCTACFSGARLSCGTVTAQEKADFGSLGLSRSLPGLCQGLCCNNGCRAIVSCPDCVTFSGSCVLCPRGPTHLQSFQLHGSYLSGGHF